MGRSDPLHFVDMEKIQEKIERRGEMEKDRLFESTEGFLLLYFD